jgi:hypothetical protein
MQTTLDDLRWQKVAARDKAARADFATALGVAEGSG